jgi:hypothetical protein
MISRVRVPGSWPVGGLRGWGQYAVKCGERRRSGVSGREIRHRFVVERFEEELSYWAFAG